IDNDTYSLDSSIKSAEIALDNARISLEDAQDTLEDYSITAPIDGTIITKNNKAGDKLEQNSNSSSEPMAIIYDMSVLKIQLSLDESDIQDIQVGQSVSITADAVAGEFTGEVTKVGINGTSENGVTTYPVDITLTEYGDLLPGMNVDCVIEVESAENVLAVPSEAIQRGNRVYVKGDKTEENDKAPDGYYSVSVTTGATDGTYIEIKEGLEEGQEVCGAAKASGVEAEGAQEAQQQQMQMPGGMGAPAGGMGAPPGGGGNRGGNAGGNRGGAPGGR
ncbi:MAG: efflux RND transporter periplasmic adaptor subunit, partial [Candidatus Ornithomonoglobus sp.]